MSNMYWNVVGKQFFRHKLAVASLVIIFLYVLVAIYAPFLASSRPIIVKYNGEWYFPLFRYLFYSGFYTKKIDLFFNLLIFTFPFFLLGVVRSSKKLLVFMALLQLTLFLYFAYRTPDDPASDPILNRARQEALTKTPSWDFELQHMSPYEQINTLTAYRLLREQNEKLSKRASSFLEGARKKWIDRKVREAKLKLHRDGVPAEKHPTSEELTRTIAEAKNPEITMPTLWNQMQQHYRAQVERLSRSDTPVDQVRLKALRERHEWLENGSQNLQFMAMPLVRHFHWEDDAGGQQSLNRHIPWYELTRINRKDLVAALIFGVRISLVVGVLAVALALVIGIPFGAVAGYYGGRFDIIVSRLLEIWESMPTFFMLLLVVAITQSKSIFIVISVIGLFGWTSFARYIRGEFFKQRNLPYVEACKAQGFSDRYIIFTHVLPNAIPPILTLLPFSIMGAITAEAALSFLGLGEEGSSSWGVLMDEGRSAFPGESYLLWPPATLLTILLISIALVGDALRDALDPKLHAS